jgi:hypothetical protein
MDLQCSKDLWKIQQVNGAKKPSSEFMARFSLVLGKKDFVEEIQALDRTIESLERLSNSISINHRLIGSQPDGKSKRLARALFKIRDQAEAVYVALSKGWVMNCHHKHEAKLFLEDRLEQSKSSRARESALPMQAFELILAGSILQRHEFWHESMVEIFEDLDEAGSEDPQANSVRTNASRVSINVPLQAPVVSSQVIKDICSTIEDAKTNQHHAAFTLTKDGQIAEITDPRKKFVSFQARCAISLEEFLSSTSQDPGRSSKILWKDKLALALNIASSFLQLLQTPWSSPRLSACSVVFLEAANKMPDACKPLLSVSFDPAAPAQQPARDLAALKSALIDLGVVLLEIWHETTLESKFSLTPQSLTSIQRRMYALEWLENEPRSLPDLYQGPVCHCLTGALNSASAPRDCNDLKLWESMCENVITPLSKLAGI